MNSWTSVLIKILVSRKWGPYLMLSSGIQIMSLWFCSSCSCSMFLFFPFLFLVRFIDSTAFWFILFSLVPARTCVELIYQVNWTNSTRARRNRTNFIFGDFSAFFTWSKFLGDWLGFGRWSLRDSVRFINLGSLMDRLPSKGLAQQTNATNNA